MRVFPNEAIISVFTGSFGFSRNRSAVLFFLFQSVNSYFALYLSGVNQHVQLCANVVGAKCEDNTLLFLFK